MPLEVLYSLHPYINQEMWPGVCIMYCSSYHCLATYATDLLIVNENILHKKFCGYTDQATKQQKFSITNKKQCIVATLPLALYIQVDSSGFPLSIHATIKY